MFACELYLLKKHPLNLDLLCVAQNGIVLELRRTTATQTATHASLQTNGLKGATMTKAMSFCVSECKGDEMGIVISLLGMHAFIKRKCLCTLYGCSSLQLMLVSAPSPPSPTHPKKKNLTSKDTHQQDKADVEQYPTSTLFSSSTYLIKLGLHTREQKVSCDLSNER